jgi:hypothetical protein
VYSGRSLPTFQRCLLPPSSGRWSWSFLTMALNGVEWSASSSGRFTPWESTPDTNLIGRYVGLRTGLDMMAKRNFPASIGNPTPVVQAGWLSFLYHIN